MATILGIPVVNSQNSTSGSTTFKFSSPSDRTDELPQSLAKNGKLKEINQSQDDDKVLQNLYKRLMNEAQKKLNQAKKNYYDTGWLCYEYFIGKYEAEYEKYKKLYEEEQSKNSSKNWWGWEY